MFEGNFGTDSIEDFDTAASGELQFEPLLGPSLGGDRIVKLDQGEASRPVESDKIVLRKTPGRTDTFCVVSNTAG